MSKLERVRPALRYSEADELAGQVVLEQWAAGHTDHFLTLADYDPERWPYQRLDFIHLPAKPDQTRARQLGELGMGKVAYDELVADLRRFGLIYELGGLAANGASSIVVSSHFRNILDTPITHNAAFTAAGSDEFAHRNLIVANHMVKRLETFGIGVPEIIRASGEMVFGHPPEGAKENGMPADIISSGNRAMAPIFRQILEKGAVVHRALPDTRAKDIVLADGSPAISLKKTDESLVNIVTNRMKLGVAIPIDVMPGNGKARVLYPIEIQEAADVHYMMEQSAQALSEMSGQEVVYDLPDGAKYA